MHILVYVFITAISVIWLCGGVIIVAIGIKSMNEYKDLISHTTKWRNKCHSVIDDGKGSNTELYELW